MNTEHDLIIPQGLSVVNAKLPKVYESAKTALEQCSRIDECKDWADKAEAIASYARQADDDSLLKMATRVRARAIRRCGELLKEIEPAQGARTDIQPSNGNGTKLTRNQAAKDAGLSKRQKDTALQVASIPPEEFEAVVESENPPTTTALAEQGKKPQPKPILDLQGRDPYEFALSTQGQGWIRRLAECAKEIPPEILVRGAFDSERDVLKSYIAIISLWLDEISNHLEAK